MDGFIIAAVAGVLGLTPPAAAGETQAEVDDATRARVIEAIESYIEQDARVKEAFLVLDPRSGEPIRLAFDRVHEGVKAHERGYVVVVEKDPDPAEVAKVFLRKVEGKPVTPK